ncbi:hypothetical protein HMPREF9946_00403 [Acetobacteraceae bacterium AT-5844]|nr:hypothetical protein HMPREF9946_00403 [Acetobacteraceae bacterium AT-5844]
MCSCSCRTLILPVPISPIAHRDRCDRPRILKLFAGLFFWP